MLPGNEPLGPSGKFPEGRIRHDDCGELVYRVGSSDENVFIDFAAPVEWLAMPPATARAFAETLLKMARRVETIQGLDTLN